jgi:hypothetical protein
MTTSTAGQSSGGMSPMGVGLGAITELVVPGGSNLIKGDLKEGGIHLLLAWAAGALLGPLGVLAVRANSLAKATTGRGMIEQLTTEK